MAPVSSRTSLIGFLLIVCGLAHVAPATARQTQPSDRAARLAVLRKSVEDTVRSFEQDLTRRDARLEARQFTMYAHYVLALDLPDAPAKAVTALRRAMALQDMREGSRSFGEFAAFEGSNESGTATEFTVLPLAQVVMRYGDKLPADLRDQLAERLKTALKVIRGRNIPADAGNVFLISAVDQLLIGEIARDERAVAESAARLTNYLSIARSRGINEYVSPNWTSTQLGVLLIGHNYTTQPEPKRMLESVAKFVWSQVAANVVPRRGLLGGPHSREVDFVHGSGTIDAFLFLEGLRATPPQLTPFSDGLRAYLNDVEWGFRPDEKILKLAELPDAGGDRLVRMRWGINTGNDRYFYLTPDFAMGSSSMTGWPNDKKLTVEFPTPKPIPTIWVVSDPFDAPYGRLMRQGRPIPPMHINEKITAVQDKGTLLAIMNYRQDLAALQQLPPTVGTNVIVPLGADQVLLDGKPIVVAENATKPFELPATTDSVVIVREGTGAVAMRIFVADGAAGQQPVVQLKYDGNPWGAARLVAWHYRGGTGINAPKVKLSNNQPVRAGVIFLAGRCATPEDLEALKRRAADVKIEQPSDPHAWKAKLTDGDTTLEADMDLDRGTILSRKVNDQDYLSPTFRVNDKDLAAEYLSGW